MFGLLFSHLYFFSLFCYYLMKLGIWAKSECGAKSGFVSFWLVCGCEREAMVNTQNTHTHTHAVTLTRCISSCSTGSRGGEESSMPGGRRGRKEMKYLERNYWIDGYRLPLHCIILRVCVCQKEKKVEIVKMD